MKIKKCLKAILFSSSIATLTLATSLSVVSCGKKHDWTAFKKAAEAETAKNIVTHLVIGKWSKDDQLSFLNDRINADDFNHTLEVTIINITKEQQSTLTIAFSNNHTYSTKNWKSSPVSGYQNWDQFKTDALKNNGLAIWSAIKSCYLKGAVPLKNSNVDLTGIDLSTNNKSNLALAKTNGLALTSSESNNTITLVVRLEAINNNNLFEVTTLTFVDQWKGQVFNIKKDWACNYDSKTFFDAVSKSIKDNSKAFQDLVASLISNWSKDSKYITWDQGKTVNNTFSLMLKNSKYFSNAKASIKLDNSDNGLNKIYGETSTKSQSPTGWIFSDSSFTYDMWKENITQNWLKNTKGTLPDSDTISTRGLMWKYFLYTQSNDPSIFPKNHFQPGKDVWTKADYGLNFPGYKNHTGMYAIFLGGQDNVNKTTFDVYDITVSDSQQMLQIVLTDKGGQGTLQDNRIMFRMFYDNATGAALPNEEIIYPLMAQN